MGTGVCDEGLIGRGFVVEVLSFRRDFDEKKVIARRDGGSPSLAPVFSSSPFSAFQTVSDTDFVRVGEKVLCCVLWNVNLKSTFHYYTGKAFQHTIGGSWKGDV